MSDNYQGGVATQEQAATSAQDTTARDTTTQSPTGGTTGDSAPKETPWWEGKNFDEAPQFQGLKSTYDRKLNDLSNNFGQAQRYIQESQQRMSQLEQQLEAQQLSGAGDYEKLEHFYKKEQKRSQMLEQQLMNVQQEIARQNYVHAIKDEFGVDLSGKQFNSPDEAMLIVAKMQRERASEFEKKVQLLERKVGAVNAADNEKPDLGGTGTPIGKHALQERYTQAMLGLQSETADKILRQAKSEGIDIDRFDWIKQRKVDS